jgi:hypothetical protein
LKKNIIKYDKFGIADEIETHTQDSFGLAELVKKGIKVLLLTTSYYRESLKQRAISLNVELHENCFNKYNFKEVF